MPDIRASGNTVSANLVGNQQPSNEPTGKNAKKNGRKLFATNPFKWRLGKQAKSMSSKSFASRSWQIGKVKTSPTLSLKRPAAKGQNPSSVSIQTPRQQSAGAVDTKTKQETYFKGFKQFIGSVKTEKDIVGFEQSVKGAFVKGNLSQTRCNELLSLANLKRGDIQLDKAKSPIFNTMLTKASEASSLRAATDVKREMMMQLAKGGVSESEHMRLQGKLTRQLRVLSSDKQQARGMTIELLKLLTGSYAVAKDLQAIATKTLGFTPHKSTGGLEERLHNLKKG